MKKFKAKFQSILLVLLLIIISTILKYTNIDTIIYNYIYNIL